MSSERSARVFTSASREPAKIKGAAFIEILKWYSTTHGRSRNLDLGRAVPQQYQHYISRPDQPTFGLLAGTWYEADMVAAVFQEMTAGLSPLAVRQLAEEAVRVSVGTTLSGIYAGIIRMLVSPTMLADHYQKLWRLYHNTGEFKVHVLGPAKYEFRLSKWPAHNSFLCQMNLFATRLILELIGLKGVNGQQGACIDKGDQFCSYIQTWKE